MALPELTANAPTPGSAPLLTELSAELKTGITKVKVKAAPPAALQATGQFRIVIGSEIMLIEGTSSSTEWTILERKAEGSTEANHLINTAVYHYLNAGATG